MIVGSIVSGMHRIYQSSLTQYSSSSIGVVVPVEDVVSVNYCPVADQPTSGQHTCFNRWHLNREASFELQFGNLDPIYHASSQCQAAYWMTGHMTTVSICTA